MKIKHTKTDKIGVTTVKTYGTETFPFHLHLHNKEEQLQSTTSHQKRIIQRLDDIVDLLYAIYKIDKLLLNAERKEIYMANEVKEAIQDLIAATEEQTTTEAGIEIAIQGATSIMAIAVEKIEELAQDLSDNAGDAAAVREITARLQSETQAMRASQEALVSATAPLATAVQANVGTNGNGGSTDTTPTAEAPMEPAVEPTEG